MKDIEIIASSSKGNCYKYFNVMVDVGVPYVKLKKALKHVNLVLLTHKHGDHLNIGTLEKIAKEHKRIKFGVPEHLLENVREILDSKRLIPLKVGKIYDFKRFTVRPIKLYHDVQNCGYMLNFAAKEFKVFHATDTAHLKGIKAPGFDVYVVECNYSQEKYDELYDRRQAVAFEDKKTIKELNEQLKLFENSINTHLSDRQFDEFIKANAKKDSIIFKAHKSSRNL